jgi:hypothetical protein
MYYLPAITMHKRRQVNHCAIFCGSDEGKSACGSLHDKRMNKHAGSMVIKAAFENLAYT